MTNLDELFAPENEFIVPVTVALSNADQLKLRKFINLHYLEDVNANELVDGKFVAKYPEKETEEFKNAVRNITVNRVSYLKVIFDINGKATFEVLNND